MKNIIKKKSLPQVSLPNKYILTNYCMYMEQGRPNYSNTVTCQLYYFQPFEIGLKKLLSNAPGYYKQIKGLTMTSSLYWFSSIINIHRL